MLAVLDPLLFSGSEPIAETELDEIARILRDTKARIPAGAYWKTLEVELIRPFSRQASHKLRAGLDAIRSFVSHVMFPLPPARFAVWDFRTLFDPAGPEWVDLMARTLTGCSLTGEATILITGTGAAAPRRHTLARTAAALLRRPVGIFGSGSPSRTCTVFRWLQVDAMSRSPGPPDSTTGCRPKRNPLSRSVRRTTGSSRVLAPSRPTKADRPGWTRKATIGRVRPRDGATTGTCTFSQVWPKSTASVN
jgi:hypothetical protein